eukprot:122330-Ditylum_brightwellii.AAC.1
MQMLAPSTCRNRGSTVALKQAQMVGTKTSKQKLRNSHKHAIPHKPPTTPPTTTTTMLTHNRKTLTHNNCNNAHP